MEQEAYIEQEEIFETDLHLDMESRNYLREAAKWARFLGILGFIGCGLLALIMIGLWFNSNDIFNTLDSTNRELASLGIGTIMFIYLILAVLSFFVALFTFRFGQRTYRALLNDNQIDLRSGMSNLRFIFRLYGIMAIVYLSVIALIFLIGILF